MKWLKSCIFAAFACAGLHPAHADEAFIEANILSIFYHELGHALIDVVQLPVFGQEEDAADVLSVILINDLFDEETAVSIAYDAAFGFLAEAEQAQPVFWDVHGPDEQRYFTLVCLFFGANPDEREDLAQELGLPEDRAVSCEEEYELAADSWGGVLDELQAAGPGSTLKFSAAGDGLIQSIVRDEVAALNAEFSLPHDLDVVVEACEEANAFYDPEARQIIICTELHDHLTEMAKGL